MASPQSVAIIILTWNNWRDTLACVDSCRTLTWPNFRIIIVDNGSTDDSENQLRQHCPEVEIIQTGKNLGFAGGNNVGIRHAMQLHADYIWLLNNDAVAEPDSLAKLVETMEKESDAAFAGSKIYYHDDPQRIWFAGGIWEKNWLNIRQKGAGEIDHGQFDRTEPVGSVSGCSMIARRAAINKIGLMDESYFLYWEDTDWCARAWEKGYKVLFTPYSHVRHKVSSTIAPRSEIQYYYNTRNGMYFCRRHGIWLMPLFLLYVAADVAAGLFQGNRTMLAGAVKGVVDFFKKITGPKMPSKTGA